MAKDLSKSLFVLSYMKTCSHTWLWSSDKITAVMQMLCIYLTMLYCYCQLFCFVKKGQIWDKTKEMNNNKRLWWQTYSHNLPTEHTYTNKNLTKSQICQLFSSLWWRREEAAALLIGCSRRSKTKHLLYVLHKQNNKHKCFHLDTLKARYEHGPGLVGPHGPG